MRAGRIDKRALRRKAAATLHEFGVEGIDVGRTIRELSLDAAPDPRDLQGR